ncbi:hypothetical protein [Heliorestis convoluta]|uniref:Putative membrane protein n=1 Tax=Heliorestis convoluta TaxID=356322 RepID=A0A5Q2N4S0_9FIRM|nr:hypothetical protein [Heliorestis convoluta]QGG47575.1 putative membrane protein [Heliorestis convoluta]
MDWIYIAFLSWLVICVVLIIATLVTLPQLGDERKDLIKMKAQSYAFATVIFWLIFETGKSIYFTIWTDKTYTSIEPAALLIIISGMYLITLFYYKKKYGG